MQTLTQHHTTDEHAPRRTSRDTRTTVRMRRVETPESESREALDRLVALGTDAANGLNIARRYLATDESSAVVRRMAVDRATAAQELARTIAGDNVPAAARGTLSGALHRSWMQLVATAAINNVALYDEIDRGHRALIAAYRRALGVTDAPEVVAVLQRHVRAIETELAVARALRTAE